MERQAAKVKALLESLKEQPARHRPATTNPRIEEALRVLEAGTYELDVLLKQDFPDLMDCCDFYYAFLDAKDRLPLTSKICEILYDHRTPTVFNNLNLMLKLCEYDPRIYCAIREHGHGQLKSNPQILKVVLERVPFMITCVPAGLHVQNSFVVGKALGSLPLWHTEHCKFFKRHLASSAWRNRDIVRGWVNGGGLLHREIPQSLCEDREILLIASGHKKETTLSKPTLPSQLKSDKDFMCKAVEQNPSLLNFVAEKLRGDEGLAIAALSGIHGSLAPRLNVPNFWPQAEEGFSAHRRSQLWFQVGEQIRQKFRAHDAFVQLILGSIHFSYYKPSNLAVLNQGDATSKAHMKLIGEFAGASVGEDFLKLCRARKNLASNGIAWSL